MIRQFHYAQLEPLDARVLNMLPATKAAAEEAGGFELTNSKGAMARLFAANNHGLWRYIDRGDHFEGAATYKYSADEFSQAAAFHANLNAQFLE